MSFFGVFQNGNENQLHWTFVSLEKEKTKKFEKN